jgi:Na+/melibiose symporter-like transporter
MTSKFGIGAAVGITFPILAWMGFDPLHLNAPAAIEHMRLFNILLPIGLWSITLWITLGYKLDEAKQQRLRDTIDRARAAHHSADDVMPPAFVLGGAALASDSEAVTHVVGKGE